MLRQTPLMIVTLFAGLAFGTALTCALAAEHAEWLGRTPDAWLPELAAPSEHTRDSALSAFEVLEPTSARSINAAAAMLGDPSQRVRESAQRILIEGGRHPQQQHLVFSGLRASLGHESVTVRVMALRVVSTLAGLAKPLASHITVALGDSAAPVRSAAAAAIGSVLEGEHPGGRDSTLTVAAIGVLFVATSDASPEVRHEAIAALGRVAPSDARLLKVLANAYNDASPDVRATAAAVRAALP